MIKRTITDMGILVAALNKREKYHAWTLEQMRSLTVPMLTCEAVITEACHLMRTEPNGKEGVLNLIERGILRINFSLETEVGAIKDLITKYENVPMDFADGCLVRMSELNENATVFTLDGDFWIYRKDGGKQIPLIIPEDVRMGFAAGFLINQKALSNDKFYMNLFPFQIEAASRIAERFQTYNQNPLLVTRTEILPFYQNLSSITGSGKTLILVETIVNLRAMLPLEPIVLWISEGKVVVEQTLHNLSNGKYAASLGNFTVKPLLEATKDEIEDTSKSGDTKEPKPKLAPKKKFLVPKIDKDSEAAYPFIKRIVDAIPDFRADSVNTVGNGEKQVVRQRVGNDEHAPDVWVEVPHSNLVNARFVFNREIQKHYADAAQPCEMHEAKFDAKIEYNSRAADLLRQSAIDVVDTFLEHSEIVQSYAEPDEVPEMAVDPVNCEKYKNAIHESYSGLNTLEKEFAGALDAAGNPWCRNPSRGFFEIPLLDKGRTKNFNPDFLVWSGKTAIFAIDTKGDHLIKEDSARKLFHVKKLGKGPDVFVRLVTKGEWNNQVQRISTGGFTVWILKNGMIQLIKAQNVGDAVQICLREN